MKPEQLTALIGALGILATVGVAVFTQIYQGRQQDQRDTRAAKERRDERWEQERYAAYRVYLERLTREQTLYRGLGTDDYEERRRAQSDALWSGVPTTAHLFLIAPKDVRDAVWEHDRCFADAADAWRDFHHRAKDDPGRAAAWDRLRTANRAAGDARQAVEDAIRADMGLTDE